MNQLKKIRLLVDAHIFDKSYQGIGTYIHGIYTVLVSNPDFDIVLCSHDISKLRELFPDPRFKFIQLKSTSSLKRLLVEFPEIIKREKIDYAHFQYVVPFVKPCRYINTIHDILFLSYTQYFSWSYRLTKGLFFRFSALRADVILTVSDFSKMAISNRFKIDSNRIFVTPNAVANVNSHTVKTDILDNLGKYILFVSRFEPRKNHIGLLKVYLNLKLFERGYNLVFVGSKSEKIEIEAFEKLKAEIPEKYTNYIYFFEGLTNEELSAFYKNADCFVFPSFAEGFGIPPLEAGINGCKVLCSNKTAMRDFGFFKYLFDPVDSNMFQEKMIEILEDQNYPFEKIKNSILKKYNWDEISKDFGTIIKKDYYQS